jgi:hypothetical protein
VRPVFAKIGTGGRLSLADICGFIPTFLSLADPRPAREQLDAHYQHGGGWRPQEGFTMHGGMSLHYPGDPAFRPLAMARFRDEKIVIYEHEYVAVIQPDGSFEVSRMN